MNIEFVRAEIEDAPKLIEVQNKSFYDDFSAYGECPAYNEPLHAMETHIKEAITYKILKDKDIIGDIIVRKRENNIYYLRVLCVRTYILGRKQLYILRETIPMRKYGN